MQMTETNNESDTVTLPLAVRKRMEKIRQMESQLQEPSEDEVVEPAAALAVEPNVTTESASEPVKLNPSEYDFAATDLLEAPAHKMSDPVYWRHRASAMQGMFRVEQKRLKDLIAARDGRISELENEVVKLQAEKPVVEAEIDLSKFFTPEQLDDVGEDHAKFLIKTAMAAARETVQDQIAKHIEPQRQSQKDAEQERRNSEWNSFLERLTSLVPNWQVIDESDAWKMWLAQIDDASGFERQELLNKATNNRDERRTAALFNSFLAAQGGKRVDVPAEPPIVPRGDVAGSNGGQPTSGVMPLKPGEAKDYYTRKARGKTTPEEDALFDKRLNLTYG